MKSIHKEYHRKLEWPDKTLRRLPDLFLERQESETQSLADFENDENVTVNSKVLFPDVQRTDFFKDSMLHNMLENHLWVFVKQTKTKSEKQLCLEM